MVRSKQQNSRVVAYLVNHLRVFIASLGHLTRNPAASLMTSAVIAIALALPTGLYVTLGNVGQLGDDWNSSAQISLYMHPEVSLKQAEDLAARLRLNKQIRQVEVISKDKGLAQFKQHSGFGSAMKFLDDNPLPVALRITPIIDPVNPGSIKVLLNDLQSDKLVDIAQLDLEWVQRLYALLEIAQRGVWIIGGLLSLAVLLIVGNTIRLDIQNRRAESEVAKLIGASNAFIRRPFLYTGLWYGLIGGFLAWLLTLLSLLMLHGPVSKLSQLYQSQFELSGLSLANTASLLLISCLLGLIGSWLAVGRHLDAIEPS